MGCNVILKTHFLESHLDFFPENLGEVSDEQVKDFTKTFWLWKSGTKASGPQVCWQPITGESRMPLQFRGKFLPVPLVRKVPFCTDRVICNL